MTTCFTPRKSAAARCSSARLLTSCSGGSDRSAVPAPPLVQSTYVTSQPAATHLATTPPDPISASSGWAKITITLSGTSVTSESFGVLATWATGRLLPPQAPAGNGRPLRERAELGPDHTLAHGDAQAFGTGAPMELGAAGDDGGLSDIERRHATELTWILRVVEWARAMHRGAVVPDHEVADAARMAANSVSAPTGGTILAESIEYRPGGSWNDASVCHSRLPSPYMRRRSADFKISPCSSTFEMSERASWPRRLFPRTALPVLECSWPSSRCANASCSSSLNGWSRKTRMAYSSIPARIRASVSRSSA